jgi:hypothetical protein
MFRTPQRQHRPPRTNNRQKARVEKQRRERDAKRHQRRLEPERRREPRRAQPRPAEITDATTSADRYADRLAEFYAVFGDIGWWLHLAAWIAHNCVAHPLLGLFPGPRTVDLHDRTSDWLNLRRERSRSPVPTVGVPWAWIIHNCVAHPLIGLFPQQRWFSFHDTTAEQMEVEGWL